MSKKLEELEEKLDARANEIVQEKINKFKAAIESALNELFEKTSRGCDRFGNYGFADNTSKSADEFTIERAKAAVLRLAITDNTADRDWHSRKPLPWPSLIWERERNAVREELLAKVDLMQKLLMQKKRDTANDVVPVGSEACEL